MPSDVIILIVLSLLLALLFVRNTLVYRVRMRAIDQIHAKNISDLFAASAECSRLNCTPDAIDKAYGETKITSTKRYDTFDSRSYYGMVFDLTKWTYKQFYPAEEFE